MKKKELIVFQNLKVDDFIHPEEKRKEKILNSSASKAVFDSINALCQSIMLPIINGSYVQVDPEAIPRLYRLLKQVCMVLNYTDQSIILCLTHNFSSAITPCGTEKQTYILIPQRLVYEFDDDMLRYALGNAVTMLKAGHVKFANIAGFVPGAGPFEIIKKPFIDFIHTADATSDRGGLLACQSFSAAVRCQLFEMGLPVSESGKLFDTDEQAVRFVSRYLDDFKRRKEETSNFATNLARTWYDISYIEAAGNLMLSDLFNWYLDENGYQSVIRKYQGTSAPANAKGGA